jgi:hypothetical protein
VSAAVTRVGVATGLKTRLVLQRPEARTFQPLSTLRHGAPRYDTVLEALAPSVSARRDLLHGYFEPANDEECSRSIKVPTGAHLAPAQAVDLGRAIAVIYVTFVVLYFIN